MTDTHSLFPCLPVPEEKRLDVTAELFGMHFPMKLEPFVYFMADTMCKDYQGGYWEFYALINGGFYMAPAATGKFNVRCENGFEGELSADAFGTICCLYAYSHLSFDDGEFAQTCAEQYHLLRDYMLEHPEVGVMLRAID